MTTRRGRNDDRRLRSKARVLGALMLVLAATAPAQDSSMTVFGGYRFGSDFEESESPDGASLAEARSFGLLLSLPEGPRTDYEFFFHRQNTRLSSRGADGTSATFDLTVDYWQAGGRYFLEGSRVLPFVSGSLGLTHFDPNLSGGNSETRFSLSLGGGVQIPLAQHWSLRFDLRGFLTAIDSGGSMFCAEGRCAVRVAGSGFWQADVGAGLSYHFGSAR